MPKGVKQYSNQPVGVFEFEGFWEVWFTWHKCGELLFVPEIFLSDVFFSCMSSPLFFIRNLYFPQNS